MRHDKRRWDVGTILTRDHPPVLHADNAAGMPGHVRIMCHHHDCLALIRAIAQQLQDAATVDRVEGSGGLVREHDRRTNDQGPGDGDALLLTAR